MYLISNASSISLIKFYTILNGFIILNDFLHHYKLYKLDLYKTYVDRWAFML